MSASLHRGGDGLEETHEINITPFIDVILVLLIIFMVAAPLATVDVPVDLPSSNAPSAPKPEKPLYVTLDEQDRLSVGEETVSPDALAHVLDTASEGNKETRILVRADKTVHYGRLMELLDDLRDAGYLKVALVGREE